MGKRLVLLASYFVLAPIFLFSLIFYQLYLYHQDTQNPSKVLGVSAENVQYESLPDKSESSSYQVISNEARVDALKEFFARYNSPLEEFSHDIVNTSDKYGLDWRLLPAIAMQESTLCEKAPRNSYNCWGFGIYGSKVTRFSDFTEAIDTVSKTLASDYHSIGLVEPHEIMTKYTPSNSGEWAENVSYVMDRILASL